VSPLARVGSAGPGIFDSWKDLAKDSFDVEAAGKRGYGYEVIDQLALEHLMGV
jgi:xylose isomerase